MSAQREFPVDPHPMDVLGGTSVGSSRPDNEMQALMEAAPGDEPERSLAEEMPLRERLAEAIDTVLTERERWVFEALVCAGWSLRVVARHLSMSKSQIANIRDAATAKLRAALEDDEIVNSFLH